MNILLVSKDYYPTEAIAKILTNKGHDVRTVYRDYNFQSLIASKVVQSIDLIVSDGTCKTKDEESDGKSFPIPYTFPAEWAKKNGIKTCSFTRLKLLLWLSDKLCWMKIKPFGI